MQAIIKMKAREEHNKKLLTESKKDQASMLPHHKKQRKFTSCQVLS